MIADVMASTTGRYRGDPPTTDSQFRTCRDRITSHFHGSLEIVVTGCNSHLETRSSAFPLWPPTSDDLRSYIHHHHRADTAPLCQRNIKPVNSTPTQPPTWSTTHLATRSWSSRTNARAGVCPSDRSLQPTVQLRSKRQSRARTPRLRTATSRPRKRSAGTTSPTSLSGTCSSAVITSTRKYRSHVAQTARRMLLPIAR